MNEQVPTFETVTLERMRFGWQQFVSEELADAFAIEPRATIYREMFHGLRFQITQEVFAQHLDRRSARYPTTWKDGAKEALYAWLGYHWPVMGDLLKARYPIRYTTIEIEAKMLYPKVNVPDQSVRFAVITRQERVL